MNFIQCIENGRVKKVKINTIRAKSLRKASNQAINVAKNIQLCDKTSKTILRELYEGLRQFFEAIGFELGYKFMDHESIGFFIRDQLGKISIYKKFDRHRKLRNGINYYGNSIEIQTVRDSLIDIPNIIKTLL